MYYTSLTVISCNGSITTDIQAIVNELNEFFSSVFIKDETVAQEKVEIIGLQYPDPKFDKDTVQKCLENFLFLIGKM